MKRIRPEVLSEEKRDLLKRLHHKPQNFKEQDSYEAAAGDWQGPPKESPSRF